MTEYISRISASGCLLKGNMFRCTVTWI